MMSRAPILLLALLCCGCAVTAHDPAFQSPEQICRQTFADLDRATDAARVRDGGAHRPAGFPYLRSTRFLASFADTLQSDQMAVWTEHLRQTDLLARSAELRNLGSPQWPLAVLAEIDRCGAILARRDLASRERLLALRAAVQVPDDYANWQRWLGAYPLAAPFMALGIKGHRAQVRADFSADWQQRGRWSHWAVSPEVTPVSSWDDDELAIPALSESDWRALATRWAPSFLIQDGGHFDQPVQPLPGGGSYRSPRLFWQRGWTRFHGDILPQLTYTLWFSERPPESALDSFAGALDGLMWRVTLARDGSVLAYDTAHSCGCYHYVFPAQQMRRVPPKNAWHEQALQPQGVVPWQDVALVVRSGDHFLLRVIPRQQALNISAPARLMLRDYDELRSIPTEGRFQSLFAADGLVPGTARLERFWLWPTGVPSPGAMRQSGRHPTAFLGRGHFDDPLLLERLLLPAP